MKRISLFILCLLASPLCASEKAKVFFQLYHSEAFSLCCQVDRDLKNKLKEPNPDWATIILITELNAQAKYTLANASSSNTSDYLPAIDSYLDNKNIMEARAKAFESAKNQQQFEEDVAAKYSDDITKCRELKDEKSKKCVQTSYVAHILMQASVKK